MQCVEGRYNGGAVVLAFDERVDIAAVALHQLALALHVFDEQRRVLHVFVVQSQAFAAFVLFFVLVVFGWRSLLISLREVPFLRTLINALLWICFYTLTLLRLRCQTINHDLRQLVDLLFFFQDLGVVHHDVGPVRRKTASSHLPGRLLQSSPVCDQLVVEGKTLMNLVLVDLQSGQECKDLRVEADELVDKVRLLQLILVARKYGKPWELFVARWYPASSLNEVILDYLFVHL